MVFGHSTFPFTVKAPVVSQLVKARNPNRSTDIDNFFIYWHQQLQQAKVFLSMTWHSTNILLPWDLFDF